MTEEDPTTDIYYKKVWQDFFSPLEKSQGDVLPFPGFGFWSRSYAETVKELTKTEKWVVAEHELLCDEVINKVMYHAVYNTADDANNQTNTQQMCEPFWDKISCLPATHAGQLSVIPCPSKILDTHYDTATNASRSCSISGVWDDLTNYNNCNPIISGLTPQCDNSTSPYLCTDHSELIYSIGYSLSLITLVMALIIFLVFREIQCLRNKIHANLFCAYVLSCSCWIATALIKNYAPENGLMATCISFLLLKYFHLSTFFWMFIEGFYLFLQVEAPLHVEVVKLRHYLCTGWGLPLIVVGIWSSLTYYLQPNRLQYSSGTNDYIDSIVDMNRSNEYDAAASTSAAESALHSHSALEAGHLNDQAANISCPFLSESINFHAEWALKAPILLILACNMVFLIYIMAVVICKLRSEGTTTERSRQHWRAAKALLVIFPLLGISYIITLTGPTEGTPGHQVFQYVRAFLLSIQGFVITLPYCFLNKEIRGIIKQHWERWRLTRGSDPYIAGNRRASNRASFSMAGFYSTATTETRISAPPPYNLTPERIPLQNTSNFTCNSGRFLKPPLGNSTNNSSGNHSHSVNTATTLVNGNGLSPTSNSSNSPTNIPHINNKNGSPRRVFVTIHENEERVTTKIVERTGSSNLGQHQSKNGSKSSSPAASEGTINTA